MEVLAGLGLGAKQVFDYNRENFKFDQESDTYLVPTQFYMYISPHV